MTAVFVCPRCGMESGHPEDIRQGYCGNCHDWTGEGTACNARPGRDHPLHDALVACHMARGHEGPHTWELERSNARKGIDRLLSVFRHREIESIDSEPERPLIARDIVTGRESVHGTFPAGPWVLVRFVGGDEYAIWKHTGAIHRVGPDGAVEDDPILTVDDAAS